MGEGFHEMVSVPTINMYEEMKIHINPCTSSTCEFLLNV